MKIANDINESSSSMMSDKNSAQCEAMSMIAAQIMSNHVAITVDGPIKDYDLSLFKPIRIKNILHSLQIISDVCWSFTNYWIVDIKPSTNLSTTQPPVSNKPPLLGVYSSRTS